MKRPNVNKKYMELSFYVLIVILSVVLFEKTLGNWAAIWINAKACVFFLLKALTPFIYALFIAYFLNAPVRFFDKKVFLRLPFFKDNKGIRRGLAILTTYVLVLSGIFVVFAFLIPEIISSVAKVLDLIPKNTGYVQQEIYLYLSENNLLTAVTDAVNSTFSTNYSPSDLINMVLTPVLKMLSSLPNLLSKGITGTIVIASRMFQFVIGTIISIYMLNDKENFKVLATKIVYSILSEQNANKFIKALASSNKIFEGFIIGKIIDSIIIGILFFFICQFLNLPYAALLSVIIGATNVIPYFGPFIGAVPAIFIVVLNNPLSLDAVWTAIAILILQQFDGNILGPKILGDSTGLKPIGVIFSILIGGSFMGVFGMFFGVPIFAVIRNFFYSFLDRQLDKKHLDKSQLDLDKMQ